jgi:hypothetical protein
MLQTNSISYTPYEMGDRDGEESGMMLRDGKMVQA